jgi:hypothetical protein
MAWRGAGFASPEEFMIALGYQPDENGVWRRFDPVKSYGYGGRTYAGQTFTPYQGGGYTRGSYTPYPDYGYNASNASGLVNWRISA